MTNLVGMDEAQLIEQNRLRGNPPPSSVSTRSSGRAADGLSTGLPTALPSPRLPLAKAKFQDRARLARLAADATSASTKNANGKRPGPSNPLPAAARRGAPGLEAQPNHFQGASADDAPLPDMLGNYVDYDLSTLSANLTGLRAGRDGGGGGWASG